MVKKGTTEVKNEHYNNSQENEKKKKEIKLVEQIAQNEEQISQQQRIWKRQQIDFRVLTKSKIISINNDIQPVEENNQNKVIYNMNNGNANVNKQYKLENIVEETQ